MFKSSYYEIGCTRAQKVTIYGHIVVADFLKDKSIINHEDVAKLKAFVIKQGNYGGMVYTAGLSGSGQDSKKVFAIDLAGTDILIDAFYELAKEDSALILFSSIMGNVASLLF